MKRILYFFVLTIFNSNLFAQCDSVRVEMMYITGDNGESTSKNVLHNNSSGKILSSTKYENESESNVWRRISQDLYGYDSNDSLLYHIVQEGNDTGWVNTNRISYSYNSFGSITSYIYQNWVNNAWLTLSADSNTYDVQNRIIIEAYYNPFPSIRYLYSYSPVYSKVTQIGDSTFIWRNSLRTDNHYNANLDIILEVNFAWNNNSWDSIWKRTSHYSNFLLDSVVTMNLNTVWINSTLLVINYDSLDRKIQEHNFIWNNNAWENYILNSYEYNSSNQMIHSYGREWADTVWINVAASIFDYGPLNHIIHNYSLSGNDTGWVYETETITEVDSNGYPSYQAELIAYYDNGNVEWDLMSPPIHYSYSSTGQFLSSYGHGFPGGPFNSNCVYVNGILKESHSHYESMGGLYTDHDAYYYYADITGDSSVCIGQSVRLSLDSCAGSSYHWSNGATTASIVTNISGVYSAYIIRPSGYIVYAAPTTVTFTLALPYILSGPDSSMNICSNFYTGLSSIQQGDVLYQWYRNDSAIQYQQSYRLTFSGNDLINGPYYLVATNECGSDSSATTTIHFLLPPANPTITPNNSIDFCVGDSITLTSSPAYRYKWIPGNATTQSIKIGNSGNYRVFVYDTSGCYSVSPTVYTFARPSPPPLHVVVSNGSLTCNYGANIQWYLNGDSIPGGNQYYFTPVDSGYYSMSSYIYSNCVTYSDSFYFNPDILSLGLQSSVYVCENSSAYLSTQNPVVGGTPPYQYYWSPTTNLINYGNGYVKVSNLVNNSTYYLTVNDAAGHSITDSIHVIVDHPLIPQLGISSLHALCADEYNTVHIVNYNSSYHILKWIVNGDTVNSTVSGFQLSNSGIYQVLINDQYGCPVLSLPDTINLYPARSNPLIHAILDSNACVNGSGLLWVDHHPGESYAWYRYQGNQLLSTDTLFHVTAPYQYNLVVTDSNTCTTKSYFNFDLLHQEIEFPIVSSQYYYCDSDTILLIFPDIAGWTYDWYQDENLLSSHNSYLSATDFGYYQCIATSPSGCTATGNSGIYENTIPTVTINLSNGRFIAHANPLVHYQWFHNGVEIPNAFNNYIVPVDSGYYYIRIQNFSGYGGPCYGFSNNLYWGSCSVSINPLNAIVCVGQCSGELNATAQGHGAIIYNWSDGKVGQLNDSLCEGVYNVTITDSLGCVAFATTNITRDSISVSSVIADATCAGCSNGKIFINIQNGMPPYSISWLPQNGNLSGDTISNLIAGVYQVCVTDLSCIVCHSATVFGPPVSIETTINSTPGYFPNPVINELTLTGWQEIFPEKYSIKIYNSIGQIVLNIETNKNHFNVSELAPGVYTVAIDNSRRFYHFKFIKVD